MDQKRGRGAFDSRQLKEIQDSGIVRTWGAGVLRPYGWRECGQVTQEPLVVRSKEERFLTARTPFGMTGRFSAGTIQDATIVRTWGAGVLRPYGFARARRSSHVQHTETGATPRSQVQVRNLGHPRTRSRRNWFPGAPKRSV